jgi:hypothetical protein
MLFEDVSSIKRVVCTFEVGATPRNEGKTTTKTCF